MNIAIIGYGSLIWDLDTLAGLVEGEWQLGSGPLMPVEFSRISPKRKKALALVIEPNVGSPSRTCHIRSVRRSVEEAAADLATRERTDPSHIGIATIDGKTRSFCGVADGAVVDWLRSTGTDAAVWTDLNSNFQEVTGRPFNSLAGRDYLGTLQGDALEEAWRYITFAPPHTDTPFRRHLASDAWWQSLGSNRAQQR